MRKQPCFFAPSRTALTKRQALPTTVSVSSGSVKRPAPGLCFIIYLAFLSFCWVIYEHQTGGPAREEERGSEVEERGSEELERRGKKRSGDEEERHYSLRAVFHISRIGSSFYRIALFTE